ncbi:M24 family metallopeptidase [Thermoanaerobacterium sp. DL9XJH110]|uniref:M24 family metallopeptidase n=1 Tax=Thermoanaerobacterium sp. DL9XJH110 TaxID=3386643 RepID=UPI003BB7470C
MAWSAEEFNVKLARVRKMICEQNIKNLLIETQVNFLWLSGGRPYVNNTSLEACGSLLITGDKVYLVVNNIEGQRLMDEELKGLPVEKVEYPWWEPSGKAGVLKEICSGEKVYTDTELADKIARLRWKLVPQEKERYRETGKCASAILERVALEIKPGQSELHVEEKIKEAAASLGFNPWVTLVAADDRAYKYRHPLPTEKKIEKYALLAISGHKWGLMTSATRLIHFGHPPVDLKKRHYAVLKVDAAFIGATMPGVKVKDIFERAKEVYKKVGFAGEWKNHHQGGMAGYNSREFRATSYCDVTVEENQAYAWNPTIAGVKSEDTILVEKSGPEIITPCVNFPTVDVEYQGFSIKRPDILIR